MLVLSGEAIKKKKKKNERVGPRRPQGYIREQGVRLHPDFAREVPRQQIFWNNFNKNRNLKIKKFKLSIPEQLEKNGNLKIIIIK